MLGGRRWKVEGVSKDLEGLSDVLQLLWVEREEREGANDIDGCFNTKL